MTQASPLGWAMPKTEVQIAGVEVDVGDSEHALCFDQKRQVEQEPRLASNAGLSRELGSGRTRVEGLGSCSGRSRSPPILKRFASESAERIAGNEMTLDVERVLDCGVNGQEPLC